MSRVLVALGGNAILRGSDESSLERQAARIETTARLLADMIAAGHEVVVSHGNGPQVGNILAQNEAARAVVSPRPLDVLGAESQGQIGYLLQQAMANELGRRGLTRTVVSLVTQTVVSEGDPAFSRPTKPIGSFLTAAEARRRMSATGDTWADDAGRGWRRLVPSPRPLAVVEVEAITRLRDAGIVVIAAGGGGVPVVRRGDGRLAGVEGVIDKDLAAAKLAEQLRMDVLLILTDVSGVALDYGRPEQRFLGKVSDAELDRLARLGAFPAGSMGPKVRAAIQFVRSGGKRAVICALDEGVAGLAGMAGTLVVRRKSHRTRAAA